MVVGSLKLLVPRPRICLPRELGSLAPDAISIQINKPLPPLFLPTPNSPFILRQSHRHLCTHRQEPTHPYSYFQSPPLPPTPTIPSKMDVAYDHIQEEVLDPDALAHKHPPSAPQSPTLQTEFQEAYKSFSASPWGARLGGFFSDVRKQGETYYEGARQEASAASGGALKGFEGLKTKVAEQTKRIGAASASEGAPNEEKDERKERSESEALRESEGVIARFRVEAAKRLKELEKAEEAADAAILKFGANVGNFLREAVTIAPPTEELNQDGTKKVLFESKDQDGKRVIHSTRFEASLHAIHSSLESFAKEPDSPEWEKWKDVFNVEEKTGAIARDLEKYEELRRTMENLVPEKVEYAAFWTRYYFLRMVIETEEQRRREMLKGTTYPSPTTPYLVPHLLPIRHACTSTENHYRRRQRPYRDHSLGRRLRRRKHPRPSIHPATTTHHRHHRPPHPRPYRNLHLLQHHAAPAIILRPRPCYYRGHAQTQRGVPPLGGGQRCELRSCERGNEPGAGES